MDSSTSPIPVPDRTSTTYLDEITEADEVDLAIETEKDDEELDPRIKGELEKLNNASNEINDLEQDLDDARLFFNQCLGEATRTLRSLADSLGNSVDKARPYFEALLQAREAQQICQDAAAKYEKACNENRGAREAIKVAEQKVLQHPGTFDAAWQEMLNHADMKFVDAERQKERSDREHQDACLAYSELEARVSMLEKKLKKSIQKARPYFESRGKHQEYLQEQKKRIKELETKYSSAKESYAEALRSLEKISEEIHNKRKQLERDRPIMLEPRQEGVGAESNQDEDEAARQRERLMLSRKEERLKRILNRKRPLTKATLRSSLCLELGLDFDITDVLASPQSPSTKSIDLGDILSRSFDDYEVVDFKQLDGNILRSNYRRTKSEASED